MVEVSNQRYRWDFIGLSTDTKPTKATSKKVTNGSTYYESNTSKLYVWYGNQWYERKTLSGGSGGDYTFETFTFTLLDGTEVEKNLAVETGE